MKKKRTKRSKPNTIGKYIDTPTKTEIDIVFFSDSAGDFKGTLGCLKNVLLKGCYFQIKTADLKRKKKLYKKVQEISKNLNLYPESKNIVPVNIPLIFGLLKLRKRTQNKFVLWYSADSFLEYKRIRVWGVVLDNLLYLDLVSRFKNQKRATLK